MVGLRLQNIGLIDNLELNFQRGFTVLTGETGAGKSLLVDALEALFAGNQAPSANRLLRTGSTNGLIEATFLGNSAISNWLKEEGFDENEDLVISRELRFKDDRLINRCRLNGIVINRHQVSLLRPLVIDLTVQGQTQQLNSSANQLNWIDRLGSDSSNQAWMKVKNSWSIWHKSFISLEKALVDSEKLKTDYHDLKNLLEDLEEAQLEDPYEEHSLLIEEDRLVNSYKLQAGVSTILSCLRESIDNVPSVAEHLGVCLHELKIMSKLDSSLNVHLDKIFDLQVGLDEIIVQFEQYSSLFENDSSRLDQVQERLSILRKLQRRHGLDIPNLIEKRNELRESQGLKNIEDLIQKLRVEEQLARSERDQHNRFLTELRKKIARQFEERLMSYIRPLGLLNVRFEVEFSSCDATERGADAVQFLFSANPGECLAPLVDVASGGEMSRFLLALKTVLADVDGSSTLVFDEIDAGVSGRVSGAIASVLKELATTRQVFCVTHQPLLASVADHHFRVFKSVDNGITRSKVSYLSDIQDRQKELAELAGGDFTEARVYAASLLDQKAA